MAVTYVGVFIAITLMQITHVTISQDLGAEWQDCSQSCGGGIQKIKGNNKETRMCNIFDCPDDFARQEKSSRTGDAGCITIHYDFETLSEDRIYDTSNNANHGTIKGHGTVDEAGKFGKCLHLPKNTYVAIGSKTFHNKPRVAITIASWVKLPSLDGLHEIFHTCSSETGQGQFHFEVNNGRIHWSHHDHMGRAVFTVESEKSIAASTWYHIAATYRTTTREAHIYVNGDLAKLSINSQLYKFGASARIDGLSPEWACANIGDFKIQRPLDGYIDDFFIFKCELLPLEIRTLFQTGSFKRHEIPVPT